MKRLQFFPITAILLSTFLITLGGCAGSSAPSMFYVLNPIDQSEAGRHSAKSGHRITVGIGPVELPAYLDRPQIVVRLSRNRLRLAEFDKWAEPLKDNFSRVLVENLSGLLRAEPIAIFPLRGPRRIDYQVRVEVIRLDSDFEGKTSLIAQWEILSEEEKKLIVTRRSSISEPAGSREYEAQVAAQSRALEKLSREIAAAIKVLSR